jgi:hypothetical protein
MSARYQGRHQGRHRASSPGRAGTPGTSFEKPAVLSHALRRPLASAAAVLAVAGATAAGYASAARPHTVAASFTASPTAVAQAAELSSNQIETDAALAAARRSGVQRASALTLRQQLAADARAAALSNARRMAAERAARDLARQGILERAQSDPRAVGRLLVGDHGWADTQFGCLDRLWNKESHWRWNASNASSGAYGIPQALPGSKMASIGSDWDTNPVTQITWGLQYISARYGTPCSAWGHSQASNWY